MVLAASCCGDVFQRQGKINGAKYRVILDENLLQSTQDFKTGAKVHLPTGQ
jgi:hypothetical protein